MSAGRERLVAALDVGSAKVACFVARVGAGASVEVLGMGHRVCHGVKAGAVIDLSEAERTIRSAVEQAERVAGETVDAVNVSVSAGALASHVVEVEVAIDGHRVEDADIARVLDEARAHIDPGERVVLHAFPVCFALDGCYGVKAPVGMYGDKLAVTMHVITAAAGPLRNLETAVQRAHLSIAKFVASPYAAGLAALVDDERELGAATIDMGGGTTQLAVFAAGALVHAAVLPLGGGHVTQDIARGLLTPVDHAERLKTLFGSAIASVTDDTETIEVIQLGESDFSDEGYNRIPRSMLTGIIQPRLEEIFELARDRLADAGFDGVAGQRVVLTGGAAQLPGARDLAQRILGKQVRIGRPRRVQGLADATAGPAFAACAGLLLYEAMAPAEAVERPRPAPVLESVGGFARVGRWLKDNF